MNNWQKLYLLFFELAAIVILDLEGRERHHVSESSCSESRKENRQ